MPVLPNEDEFLQILNSIKNKMLKSYDQVYANVEENYD